jgi:hypothetical protein
MPLHTAEALIAADLESGNLQLLPVLNPPSPSGHADDIQTEFASLNIDERRMENCAKNMRNASLS